MSRAYRFMRFPEGKTKAVTFSYDDGYTDDLKIAEILYRYGMKGTFNLNSAYIGTVNKMTKEEIEEHLLTKGHEVAIHGEHHHAPGRMSQVAGINEFLNCRLSLERTFGRIIRGCAYPDSGIVILENGIRKEDIKSYMRAIGIDYARTLGGDNDAFLLPEDYLEWMPTAHQVNPKIFDYIDKFNGINVLEGRYSNRSPRLFYVWGHAYELKDNWALLEKISEKLSGKEDVWYATNIEIYDYVMAYRALVFSADEKTVYNPTLKAIWFEVGEKLYTVKSGETLRIEE